MEEYVLLENVIFESSSSSSSDSDDDEELLNIMEDNKNIRKVPKIKNYLEHVVARYTDIEFKSHFRLIYIYILYILYIRNVKYIIQ